MKYNIKFKSQYPSPKTVVPVHQAKDQTNSIRCCLSETVFDFCHNQELTIHKGQTGVATKNSVGSGNWNFWPDLKGIIHPVWVHRSELFFEHDPID